MATKKTENTVEALVLVDCIFGKVGTVVTVPEEVAKQSADLDAAPAAVAHAKKAQAK